MPERDIDAVLGAKEEFLSSTLSSLKELDTALLKVIESFSCGRNVALNIGVAEA